MGTESVSEDFPDAWGDEVIETLRDRGLSAAVFEQVFDTLMAMKVVSAAQLASLVGLSMQDARQYVRLLSEVEDVYKSQSVDPDGHVRLYYCYASELLVTLCRRRKISIAKFLQLGPMLDEFMAQVEDYYMNRAHAQTVQRVRLGKLKRDFAKKIRAMVAPNGRALSKWNFPISTNQAWDYVRTAQDLVVLKLDVPRPYLDGLKAALPSERDASSQEVILTPKKNGESPKLLTIKCKWKGCGKERQIKPQDSFQVKFCAEHQKEWRLQRARERRAARSKSRPAKPRAKRTPKAPAPAAVPVAPSVELVNVGQP